MSSEEEREEIRRRYIPEDQLMPDDVEWHELGTARLNVHRRTNPNNYAHDSQSIRINTPAVHFTEDQWNREREGILQERRRMDLEDREELEEERAEQVEGARDDMEEDEYQRTLEQAHHPNNYHEDVIEPRIRLRRSIMEEAQRRQRVSDDRDAEQRGEMVIEEGGTRKTRTKRMKTKRMKTKRMKTKRMKTKRMRTKRMKTRK